jgi:hypothetical protein
LVHRPEGAIDADVVLEFDCDGMVDERFEETGSMRGQSELDFYIRLLCSTKIYVDDIFFFYMYLFHFFISIVAFPSIPSLWRGHGK